MANHPAYLDSTGRLLGFATRTVRALTTEVLAKYDLTVPQWITLTALWREDGLTVTAIAGYSKSKLPAVSRLIGRMEEEGLVERRSPKNNRRSVQVFLTNKSVSLNHLLSLYDDINQMILEGFSSKEKKQLATYLLRITDNATRHYAAHSSEDPLVE